MKILIVDDDATERDLTRVRLTAEGYTTLEASDGVEGLEILQREMVDVIISDVLMPRMDGYRFCYEVRANERFGHLPFILVSGFASPHDEKRAFEMGADHFLVKTVAASELIQAVREVTTRQRTPFKPAEPTHELSVMKEYNEQLVMKLEQKNIELIASNQKLLSSRKALKLFRTLIDHSNDAIQVIDPATGRFLDINQTACRRLGYTREEMLSMRLQDIVDTGGRPFSMQSVMERTQKAGFRMVESRHRRKDDSTFPVEVNVRYIQLDRDYMVAVVRDITERKQAEEQIAEQAALLDKAHDAILVRDLDGTILFWNKGAELTYGWTHEEAIGRKVAELYYPDVKKFEECNRLTTNQGEWHGELHHLTKDRREITVEARWTLIRDPEGQPKSVLAINTDITERKKIEAQFLRAQRMESIGTLAGGVAHDLNNILAPIMMAIQLLKEMSDDPGARKILETLDVSARRGADIVRQVLSFARGLEGQRIEVDPKHVIKDLAMIIKDTFPKDIRLNYAIPNDSWTILGDPTQVHQILLNLCVNARDAMPNGGNLTIDVENCVLDEHYTAMSIQGKPGRYVNISVTDSGTGMTPDVLDKIFEPFFTTKSPDKGTGLGLSTVMAIVRSHDGVINVYSEPGKGTTFKVSLPAIELSTPGRNEGEQESLPRGGGEEVLVIEDEASILTITSQTLQAFGYRVLTATDGAEALAIYAQKKDEIAVVLTDMTMPILDGPATIRALMRINPKIKIVAASGLNPNGPAAGMGVKHFLTKPYTAGTLLKTLRVTLDETLEA
jgi:PAS domain S-box-containing protein